MSSPQLTTSTTPPVTATSAETPTTPPPEVAVTSPSAASEATPTPEAETPAATPAASPRRGIDAFTGLSLGHVWTDLSNGQGLDHEGWFGRAEGGVDIPLFDTDLFVQVGGGGWLGGVGKDLGSGVSSSLDIQSLFINARFGGRLFGDMVRLHGGADIGWAHVNTEHVEFFRNAQVLPMDGSGMYAALELGAGFYHGVASILFRYGGIMGVSQQYNFLDAPETNPPQVLNIPLVTLELAIDVLAIGREILGSGSPAPSGPTEADDADETEGATLDGADATGTEGSPEGAVTAPPTEGTGAAPAPSTAPAAESATAVIERSTEGVSERSTIVSTAATRVQGENSAFSSMRRAARGHPEILREHVLVAVAQAREALRAYSEIMDLLTQATRADRSGLSTAEARAARQAIDTMGAQARAAYRLARQARTQALHLVEEFNGLPNHGENITTESMDAPLAAPRARRASHHDDSGEETSPPPTTPPPTTPPPTTGGAGDDDGHSDVDALLGAP